MNGAPLLRWSSGLSRSVPELLLAGIAAVLITFEVWVFDPGGATAGRTIAGLTAALSLAFLRQAPFAAYVVNGLAIYALVALGFPSDFYQYTNLIATFAVASRAEIGKALISLVFGACGVVYYFLRFPDEGFPGLVFAILAVFLATWFAGRMQLARTRASQATRENEIAQANLAAEQSRSELEAERSRIAQELHDIVGHAVNVMVVHAGAGQGLPVDPKAQDIFRTIASTGRSALADLDRMLDVLQGKARRGPVPGLAELDALCDAVRTTGIEVDLTVDDGVQDVAPSVGLAAYRIVQESLTNVIKHAHATSVRVEVGHDVRTGGAVDGHDARQETHPGTGLSVTVRDNGSGGQPVAGRGLRNIAERAALHGGSVRHGPIDGGGFEVSVRLPAGSTT
ncbi:MAG: histidine kinase [Actinomycetota bacterium]|nr:hypothetical protein [Geodermatophilaceae bacterium]MDQ3475474.1 histidine kinase [Actinomycetota bacterium]